MSEEERRRCIILGICGPAGLAEPSEDDTMNARRNALNAAAMEHGTRLSVATIDYVLGLIDEARATGGGPSAGGPQALAYVGELRAEPSSVHVHIHLEGGTGR